MSARLPLQPRGIVQIEIEEGSQPVKIVYAHGSQLITVFGSQHPGSAEPTEGLQILGGPGPGWTMARCAPSEGDILRFEGRLYPVTMGIRGYYVIENSGRFLKARTLQRFGCSLWRREDQDGKGVAA